ncbi:[FeFe] hydrogenase H-cluster maturation GTPase HydF [Zongyangia hominis]|uniref:[FeFe] hydrogenase H-cluster maturation GTPase HydF n=1 Tax=Zongyangia hominis TaxID=2763677 RepID=A0A926E9A7_9FIRM|nr:[FeFe] hydrogenase H-cluster maturation GTPase HydF [Zongyangia hominis]MBC8569692.1 [FeFe] hydrogenase H-cluster maturation GTPase HydF [Zongyangia hominis]
MPVNELTATPNSTRIHIGIFGRVNSGKSSLINAIASQPTALVSPVAGTTTDPVYKPIELHPLGPCVLIDTAGFDDRGELGSMRTGRTAQVVEKTDIAVLVIDVSNDDFSEEENWVALLEEKKVPMVVAVNKSDERTEVPAFAKRFSYVCVSAKTGEGIDKLKAMIASKAPAQEEVSITGDLVGPGYPVLLVAPQDIQAPKGRLILPQVQTIRDLLDHRALVSVVTTDQLEAALALYKAPPKLIITDSQVFDVVAAHTPEGTLLTSFSVLMAKYKGDIATFIQGASRLNTLTEQDKVLILEACTHNPLDGDIGRIKIPNLLRKKVGKNLTIDIRSGNDFPDDLREYALVVHCGGCMFNRKYMLSRIEHCVKQGIPITNYGILIAKIKGILDRVVY